MHIQFLGTGAGMPSKQRNVTSVALSLLDEIGEVWLFDCGEGTQHQIMHTAIRPRRVRNIFITHMHGDHIYGLPGFLGSRSFLGGEDPLTVYGPKGIKQFIEMALSLSKTHLNYPLNIVEIEEGVVLETSAFKVTAARVEHVIETFGFRIEQKPLPGELLVDKAFALGVPKGPLLRDLKNGLDVTLTDGTVVKSSEVVAAHKPGFTVTILGDTRFCQSSIKLSADADIVVHEATFDVENSTLAAAYGHATNVEAATVAMQANAKNVILTHISARFLQSDIEKLLLQAREVFMNSFIANDFDKFEWKNNELVYSK